MGRRTNTAVRGLLLALVACATSATATAAPGGLEIDARVEQDGLGVALATNPAGFASAVWRSPTAKNRVVTLRSATRAAGGRWSRTAAVAKARATIVPLGLAVDDARRSHLLWATVDRGRNELALKISTRSGSGRWSRPVSLGVSSSSGLLGYSAQANLGVAADGTATVVWCRGGDSDNVLDLAKPGTVYARTAPPGGSWSPPQALWTGRACAGTTVQVNRRGDAFATWSTEQVEIFEAQQLSSYRPAGGAWDAAPRLVPEIAGGGVENTQSPVLAADGTVRLFAPNPTSDGVGFRHATLSPAGVATKAEDVSLPSAAQTAGGWIGGGPLTRATTSVDGAGASTVLFTTTPEALPQDGDTLGAVWSASRRPEGWNVDPLDDLAETVNAAPDENWSAPELGTDATGITYATWTAPGTERPCRTATFRSTRTSGGAWTRRVLIGVQRASGSRYSCDPGRDVRAFAPPASLLWKATPRRLTVRAAPTSLRSVVRPQVRLRTKTWREIRRAGAIEFVCRASRPGLCRISLVGASRDPDLYQALEGFCRPSIGSIQLERRGEEGVVRFPIASRCYEGGRAPSPLRTAVQVPVLAVLDALGRPSGELRSTVRIAR